MLTYYDKLLITIIVSKVTSHCTTNERRVRKRDKKVRRDVTLRRQQKMEREGQQ